MRHTRYLNSKLTTRPSLQKIPMQSNFNAIAGSGPWSACLVGFHDDSYYEDWKKKREEAVARGEDPSMPFPLLSSHLVPFSAHIYTLPLLP